MTQLWKASPVLRNSMRVLRLAVSDNFRHELSRLYACECAFLIQPFTALTTCVCCAWGQKYHAHYDDLVLRVLDYNVPILFSIYLVLWLF
jgi:hypothetical protein